jgi:prophage tail gpP-like protein
MEIRIIDRIHPAKHGQKISQFNNFSLDLRYDSVASPFQFEWYFDPKDRKSTILAHVSHFHIVEIWHDGEQLLKGYILSESFTDKAQETINTLAGYSLPGVLEDCQIPIDQKRQFINLSLREIATQLVEPFDFDLIIDPAIAAEVDSIFAISEAEIGDSIKKYLTEIAAQKNINITHDRSGNLYLTKVKTDLVPIAHFSRGVPGVEMNLIFNGQEIHSHITVVKQASSNSGNASEYTIENPYAPYVYRPKIIKQDSGTDIDTKLAAENALAAELKNIKLIIKLDRWTNSDGKIFRPNNLVSVTNPQIFVYENTNWFIENVSLKGDESEMTAELTCVLPEVYNGKYPENIFTKWEK